MRGLVDRYFAARCAYVAANLPLHSQKPLLSQPSVEESDVYKKLKMAKGLRNSSEGKIWLGYLFWQRKSLT